LGIILHKKAVSHSSRRAFHNKVATYLEKAHLNLDMDVSLNYTRTHGNNRDSLTNHAWLACVEGTTGQPLATGPWASTRLVLGCSIQNLEQVKTADLSTPRDPASIPFEGGEKPGDVSYKARCQTTPEDTYKRIVEEAIADLPTTGGTNKFGLPVAVVVIIDPFDSKASTALLHLQMKVRGRTQAPEPHVLTDLYALVLPSTASTRQVNLHAIKEQVFREWFNKKYIIEGHLRPVTQTWAGAYPEHPPEMEVATVTSEGYFSIPAITLKPFLDAECTCMEAHNYMGTLEVTTKLPSLRWLRPEMGNASAPPSLQEAEPTPATKPAAGGIKSLEDLSAAGILADVPSSNGKFRILVTRDFKFYVHVVAESVTVTQGDRLFQMGSGGRKDEEEANQAKTQGKLVIPIKVENDAVHIYYQRTVSPTEQLFTFYGLHSQLTLEGHRNIGLNYHVFQPAAGGSNTVERFTVKVVRQKFWVTKRSRSAPPADGETNVPYDVGNVGCLMSLEALPNHFVKAEHCWRVQCASHNDMYLYHCSR
jgi:hypothetical protein